MAFDKQTHKQSHGEVLIIAITSHINMFITARIVSAVMLSPCFSHADGNSLGSESRRIRSVRPGCCDIQCSDPADDFTPIYVPKISQSGGWLKIAGWISSTWNFPPLHFLLTAGRYFYPAWLPSIDLTVFFSPWKFAVFPSSVFNLNGLQASSAVLCHKAFPLLLCCFLIVE